MTIIASDPPTYGISTARQPLPDAYRRDVVVAMNGTCTVEPSARVNVPAVVASTGNGVSQGALR